uniref:HDC01530 n=1 Tax=Drosophila melanogaster TaxID=7227 RepID=Q6IHR0_DROME|nr:TPA_inf: HDC01530 [Drosophila melanogaster]
MFGSRKKHKPKSLQKRNEREPPGDLEEEKAGRGRAARNRAGKRPPSSVGFQMPLTCQLTRGGEEDGVAGELGEWGGGAGAGACAWTRTRAETGTGTESENGAGRIK